MAPNPLRPLAPEAFDYAKAQHLLNRAGFGGTPAQVRALVDMGIEKAVASLVEFDAVSDDASAPTWDADIRRPPTPAEEAAAAEARRSNDEIALARIQQERNRRDAADRDQLQRLRSWWLGRMIATPRPLEEKLVLFWHGHFATGYRTIQDSYHMWRQNALFRAHAAGDFRALVAGIVHDPAMLKYLDNDENSAGRPNENLARELMELFVLGEGHGYGEGDIKEGARALTGYTFRDDAFVFDQARHDGGQKNLFGKRGAWDGDDFVRLLFERVAASEFLCLKLLRFFVNDLPASAEEGAANGKPGPETQAAVKAMAKLLRDGSYALRPVLAALFRSEFFYAPRQVASVIKSPIQLIVQAIRSFRAPVRSPDALLAAAALMGQELLQPPNVKGWEGGRAWINTATLFVRQNLMVYLLTGRRPQGSGWAESDERCDATHLLSELRESAGDADLPASAIARHLCLVVLAAKPHPTRVASIAAFLEARASAPLNDRLLGALALLTAMPEYQLC